MVQRASTVALGGYWCFPGGHVEPGETPRDAICRELAEELGIEVRPTRRVGAVRTDDDRYVLAVWVVRHVAGEFQPDPKEIADYRWLSPDAVRDVQPGLISTRRVLALLRTARAL
jgi:mutator protein MutT